MVKISAVSLAYIATAAEASLDFLVLGDWGGTFRCVDVILTNIFPTRIIGNNDAQTSLHHTRSEGCSSWNGDSSAEAQC